MNDRYNAIQGPDIGRNYNLIFLSDEIYGMLHYAGDHVSIARYYPEGTIISSGLSKWCGAGGWRLGTFSFPPDLHWLMESMAASASETYTSVSAPIQYAAVRAFQCNINIERYLWRARRILKALTSACTRILKDAGILVQEPDGAFYLFADCGPFRENLASKNICTATQLSERLLEETGVAVLPGTCFNRPPEELTARLALVNFDGARAMAKMETLPLDAAIPDDFLRNYCRETLQAVQTLADWLQGIH